MGSDRAPGRAVLPEWRCLEHACLVDDQDAEDQEEGELPGPHDASLQGKNVTTCSRSKFREPTDLGSAPAYASNSHLSWFQAGHFTPLHLLGKVDFWMIQ